MFLDFLFKKPKKKINVELKMRPPGNRMSGMVNPRYTPKSLIGMMQKIDQRSVKTVILEELNGVYPNPIIRLG
jgi:hypothetical protein